MIEKLADVDKASYLWCNRYQSNESITHIFRQISRSGDGYLYIALAIIVGLINHQSGLNFGISGLLAFAIELPTYFILKSTIKRERPFIHIRGARFSLIPSDQFSLPSGHTAGAFLIASLISVFFPSFTPFVFIWATLIGASRVMLGVHYPSDIIAGACLGISSAYAAMIILNPTLITP